MNQITLPTNLTDEQIKKIQEIIEPEPEMWHPPTPNYGLYGSGELAKSPFRIEFQERGNSYETKEEAEKASKSLAIQGVINCYIRWANKQTKYKADFTNAAQNKYSVHYNYRNRKWDFWRYTSVQWVGLETCNLETAKELTRKLNKGLIAGVPRELEA